MTSPSSWPGSAAMGNARAAEGRAEGAVAETRAIASSPGLPSLPPAPPPLPAVLRGRFEILAEIGRGGLTRVYAARDLVAARAGLANPVVALKIIAEDQGVEPDLVALMHREARRLRDLVHPNIVRVFDMEQEGRLHFMVMEQLEGQSLATLLRRAEGHRLPPARLDRIVTEVCAALAFAHDRGIVHADLKPGNIFLETSGRIKLIDFNIAFPMARRPKVDEEDTIAILGRLGALTPAYASPQRLAGAEPGSGDDVYSLAVVIYQALTGQKPFGGATAADALAAGTPLLRPEGLSFWRWQALEAALAFDDARRIADIRQFADIFLGRPRGWIAWRLGLR